MVDNSQLPHNLSADKKEDSRPCSQAEFIKMNDLDDLNSNSIAQGKINWHYNNQRWNPRERPWPRGRSRGHIFKTLDLALASKPQVLENCPLLGSRTALFFESSKLCIIIIINGQRCKRICYR